MEAAPFRNAVRSVCFPAKSNISDAQEAAFYIVCNEYGLNPILKEIYAFPTGGGGIQPIVGVDGWSRMMNDHPAYDGLSFNDHVDDKGNVVSITCEIYRKDRTNPISATEYMAECKRNTDPWKQWPRRMLRHKAMIQAARYAFGFSGIMEPDEFDRMKDITPRQTAGAATFDMVTGEVKEVAEESEALDQAEPEEAEDDGFVEGDYTEAEPEAAPMEAEEAAPPAEADAKPAKREAPKTPSRMPVAGSKGAIAWAETYSAWWRSLTKDERTAGGDTYDKGADAASNTSEKARDIITEAMNSPATDEDMGQ